MCLHIYILHFIKNYILHIYSTKETDTKSLRPLFWNSKKVLIANMY